MNGAAHAVRGIRTNISQFSLQGAQVFFVGLIIGMERNVLPAMSHHFGVKTHAFLFLASFVMSFGFVKGALNFVAGGLSDKLGRKRVLLYGWLAAIPVPLLIELAPNWWWVIVANVFLGINQAFTWTMTVTSQIDLAANDQRGLAVGINEALGYIAVGTAGLATSYAALAYGARLTLLVFGLTTIACALLVLTRIEDTIGWVRAEHTQTRDEGQSAPPAPPWTTFKNVSFRDPTYRAICQGGVANKIADTLVWVLLPIYFKGRGLELADIGWITGLYAAVWGFAQLITGHLADRLGRKIPVVAGFALLALALAAVAILHTFQEWLGAAVVMGVGMALLYPNLIAAMSDLAPPLERGRILGVYRYWRDTGYALGAILLGLVAQNTRHTAPAIWLTAALVAASGLWIALSVRETRGRSRS